MAQKRPNKPFSEQRRRRRARLFEEQNGRCVACQERFELEQLRMVRVIKRASGGDTGHFNRVLSCEPCRQARESREQLR